MKLNNVPVWLLIGIFGLGAVLGAWGMHTYTEDIRTALQMEKNKQPQIKEKVETVTNTQIAYVPKETVIIKDVQTGQDTKKELDGKFQFGKPEFVYTVNGKPGKFVKTDDEKYIFDKNMMQLTQSSMIKIDAELPTIDKTKHGYIGVGYGTNGPAAMLGIKSFWLYKDSDTKAGGLQYRF